MADLMVLRALFIALLGAAGFVLRPFDLSAAVGAAFGIFAGLCAVGFELRIRQVSLPKLIGAAVGSVLGILGAFLISLVLSRAMPASTSTVPFLQLAILAFMTYCGLVVGGA